MKKVTFDLVLEKKKKKTESLSRDWGECVF